MAELDPIFAEYVRHLERKGRDTKTVSRNRYALVRLDEWLITLGISPGRATEPILEEYLAWLAATYAPLTANRETTHVKAAFRYAARLGLIKSNPAGFLEAPKVSDEEPEVYSSDELHRIRAQIGDELERGIFYALVYGGLRRAELVGLTWDAVNFEQRFMRVRGKGGKLRRVPLHPHLAAILSTRPRPSTHSEAVLGRGGSLRNVNHRLARLLGRAAVDGGNRPAHRFRKTVATALADEGVREEVIDKIMGWAPITVRQRYYTRVADAALYQAITMLYRSDPFEAQNSTVALETSDELVQTR